MIDLNSILKGNLRLTKTPPREIDPSMGYFDDFNWTAQSAYNYEIALTPEKSLTPITNIHLEEIIHSMNKSPLPKKSDSSLDSNTDLGR